MNKTKYLSGISCDENTTCILNNCNIETIFHFADI